MRPEYFFCCGNDLNDVYSVWENVILNHTITLPPINLLIKHFAKTQCAREPLVQV